MQFLKMVHFFFARRLTEYLDSRLPAPERRRVERHILTCESCARRLAELRSVQHALHALRANEELEPALPRWSTIEAGMTAPSPTVPVLARYRLPLAGAACVVLLLALALIFYEPAPEGPPEVASRRPEPAELYHFVGDRLFTPERLLIGDSVMIGPEVEISLFPERLAVHERNVQ
jgi:anti-sigma factor RsiW